MKPFVIFKLAIRNLLGAGLRTWLNVIVLSLAFVTIIGLQGIYDGMNKQATHAKIAMELGGGQLWHKNYDPYDPISLDEAHGPVPEKIKPLISSGKAEPILIIPATIYPQGRMQSVQVKGIDPHQSILKLPVGILADSQEEIPVLIGERIAESTGLKNGDQVTLRWRDKNGVFDAREATIVHVMSTSVQSVDVQQLWVPLKILRDMMGFNQEATIIVLAPDTNPPKNPENWQFKDLNFLLHDLREIVKTKTASAMFLYVLLLSLAMLAIFDTQVLSVVKRRKEIGMLIALGMTRGKVIRLFTLEGALHGIMAAFLSALYGIPLLGYLSTYGWQLPEYTEGYGMSIGERLYPSYSAALVFGTTMLVLVVVTIVSYWPARKISVLKPTEALRGKVQ